MSVKNYKKSLVLGVSVLTVSLSVALRGSNAHVSSQTPHPPVIMEAICNVTDGSGSPSGQASDSNLCDGDEPATLVCPATVTNYTQESWVNEGGCCFIAGTQVLMSDGTEKNIEDIVEGDKVLGFNNAVHTVTEARVTTLAGRTLISIDGSVPFATQDHTFKTSNGWASADPDMTKERYPSVIEHIGGLPDKLDVGTELVTHQGSVVVASLNHTEDAPDTQVYDLGVDGDHTYHANGFVVHNCHGPDGMWCFFAGTKILMADGSIKNIESIQEGDVTATGLVHQKLARHYDFAHHVKNKNGCMLYDGIYVTGLHAVFDGKEWAEAHDLTNAMPVIPPNGADQTYNLVTEERLIPVIGNSGLHYFADNLNNFGDVSSDALKLISGNVQNMA